MDWSKILSDILAAVLLAILPPLAVYLVKWLRAQAAYLVNKIEQNAPDWADTLRYAASLAVAAAEQANLAGALEDKKTYAISIVEMYLARYGFIVDLDLIDAEIERQVLEQFPHEEPETPEPTEQP
jgi:hypothetical protein